MISIQLAIAVGLATTAIEFTDDSLARVKENITKKKAVLVDVRSKDEWDKGHVAGAIFLPIDTLEELPAEKVAKILPKERILYTHCVIGMRAEAAGEILVEQGYKVRVLKPGYKELIEAGFKKYDESPR
jgi:rhodanese-related sulfurtransferase